MKSLSEYIMEVSSGLVKRAADKASQLSKTGPNKEREYRAKQAERLYQAWEKKVDEERKAHLLKPGYVPKDNYELKFIINTRIEKNPKADLNDIDVSKVTDMSSLFVATDFHGDISKWDVSNVTDMAAMFYRSTFDGDLSDWDVSNVTNMNHMFEYCDYFNSDLSNWNVSNVTDMNCMFYGCKDFNADLSKWDVSKVEDMTDMFYHCYRLEKNPPAWYKK